MPYKDDSEGPWGSGKKKDDKENNSKSPWGSNSGSNGSDSGIPEIDQIVKKAQQRLYFLRRLKSFGVNKTILKKFYRAVVESVLTFSITVWYSGTTQKDRAKLNRIVKTASKIIGDDLQTLESLFKTRAIRKSNSFLLMRGLNMPF